jgi:hypothetical protein
MGVSGYLLGSRTQHTLLPFVEAYVRLVRERLLVVFEDLTEQANQVASDQYANLMMEPPTGIEDSAEIAELAQDRGQEFYDTMYALRQTSLNVFAAGLYHLLEQQVAALGQDATFQAMGVPVPGGHLSATADWYRRYLACDLRQLPEWGKLNGELRHVANAVKHGEGSSADELRAIRPELFVNPRFTEMGLGFRTRPSRLCQPLAGEDLFVTVPLFNEYSDAATDLLRGIGRHFMEREGEDYPCVA